MGLKITPLILPGLVNSFDDYEVFSIEESYEIRAMVGSRIAELQASRRSGSSARISASPKSIMEAVKSGKLSLDELKEALASLES